MLARLSIRAKITIVVGFLLIALTGSGLLAVSKMQAIKAGGGAVESRLMPGVTALGAIRSTYSDYRGIVRSHILSNTAEQQDAIEKQMRENLGRGIAQREAYEKLIASPEERAIYQAFVEQWDAYEKLSFDVVALDRRNLGKPPYEAHEFNQTKVNPVGSKAVALLVKAIDLNGKTAAAAIATANDAYDLALWLLGSIIGFAVVFGAGLAIYLVRDVSGGIASIVAPMQALGKGDLTPVVPHQGEGTEIGAMADSLQVFKDALIAKRRADEAATRDNEVKIERGHRVDTITRDFESMIGEIVETVSSASTELEASATTLAATAVRAQELATLVATASGEASNNVQSVASSTEEMSSSVDEISRQVQESARIASEAVAQAKTTNDRVSALAQAATRIGDVVELINTIAGQTNLLALNATIEAARAGDAGRGFAVVASEVKALAEQTAKATGEIGQQISGIQAATRESVHAIKDIGDTIGRMSEISSAIASAVEQQGAATQEISRNVQQAAHGTEQVSSNITDVQHGASETGSASAQVLSAAKSLSSDSNRLKLEVGKFLHSVRAA